MEYNKCTHIDTKPRHTDTYRVHKVTQSHMGALKSSAVLVVCLCLAAVGAILSQHCDGQGQGALVLHDRHNR